MNNIKKRITDVRYVYSVKHIIAGLILLIISVFFGFLDNIRLDLRIIITLVSAITSSYLLLTAPRVEKDILIELKDYLELKSEIYTPKINKVNDKQKL